MWYENMEMRYENAMQGTGEAWCPRAKYGGFQRAKGRNGRSRGRGIRQRPQRTYNRTGNLMKNQLFEPFSERCAPYNTFFESAGNVMEERGIHRTNNLRERDDATQTIFDATQTHVGYERKQGKDNINELVQNHILNGSRTDVNPCDRSLSSSEGVVPEKQDNIGNNSSCQVNTIFDGHVGGGRNDGAHATSSGDLDFGQIKAEVQDCVEGVAPEGNFQEDAAQSEGQNTAGSSSYKHVQERVSVKKEACIVNATNTHEGNEKQGIDNKFREFVQNQSLNDSGTDINPFDGPHPCTEGVVSDLMSNDDGSLSSSKGVASEKQDNIGNSSLYQVNAIFDGHVGGAKNDWANATWSGDLGIGQIREEVQDCISPVRCFQGGIALCEGENTAGSRRCNNIQDGESVLGGAFTTNTHEGNEKQGIDNIFGEFVQNQSSNGSGTDINPFNGPHPCTEGVVSENQDNIGSSRLYQVNSISDAQVGGSKHDWAYSTWSDLGFGHLETGMQDCVEGVVPDGNFQRGNVPSRGCARGNRGIFRGRGRGHEYSCQDTRGFRQGGGRGRGVMNLQGVTKRNMKERGRGSCGGQQKIKCNPTFSSLFHFLDRNTSPSMVKEYVRYPGWGVEVIHCLLSQLESEPHKVDWRKMCFGFGLRFLADMKNLWSLMKSELTPLTLKGALDNAKCYLVQQCGVKYLKKVKCDVVYPNEFKQFLINNAREHNSQDLSKLTLEEIAKYKVAHYKQLKEYTLAAFDYYMKNQEEFKKAYNLNQKKSKENIVKRKKKNSVQVRKIKQKSQKNSANKIKSQKIKKSKQKSGEMRKNKKKSQNYRQIKQISENYRAIKPKSQNNREIMSKSQNYGEINQKPQNCSKINQKPQNCSKINQKPQNCSKINQKPQNNRDIKQKPQKIKKIKQKSKKNRKMKTSEKIRKTEQKSEKILKKKRKAENIRNKLDKQERKLWDKLNKIRNARYNLENQMN